LRRYATQLWRQQCRHRVQYYDPELTWPRFRFATGIALGVESLDGASGFCGVERRCDVQSRKEFFVRWLNIPCMHQHQGRQEDMNGSATNRMRCECGEARWCEMASGIEP